MEHDHEASHYREKSEEYRSKAGQTTDLRVRLTLEAVAREYSRRANEVEWATGTKRDT
jgi:hypothetical protein